MKIKTVTEIDNLQGRKDLEVVYEVNGKEFRHIILDRDDLFEKIDGEERFIKMTKESHSRFNIFTKEKELKRVEKSEYKDKEVE